jgi:type I restriction enzyme S subunit
MNPYFLKHFFNSKSYWDSINAGISGAAQGGFNASKLGSLQIPIVNMNKQIEIVKELNNIEELSITIAENKKKKIQQLDFLKQSILQKAFNGELVKE